MPRRPLHPAALLVLTALGAAACVGPSASASPAASVEFSSAPSPSAVASDAPSVAPSPTSGADSEGVVVTIRTAGDEEYRILLTDPEDIGIAEQLLAGEAAPPIPNGVIVRGGDGGGVNTGYSWHIDPASVEFAEMTIELCDGRPSYVEDGTLSGDRFCPWSAEVVAIEPAG
jgi:hypothetical protein